MDNSKGSLQVVYYLCLFYLGNLLTSLFLRNVVGELVSFVGVLVIVIAMFKLSRIRGYGLKGGCVCFSIAFILGALKIPENLALYLMAERLGEGYISKVSAFVVMMKEYQVVEQIIIGGCLALKLAGWILWMRSKMFVEVKKMFYFFFADLLFAIIMLGVWNLNLNPDFMVYIASLNAIGFIAHALALMALGVIIYQLRKNRTGMREKRRNDAFILCLLTGSCYLPFLFVGYVSYQIFLLVGCVFLCYGIRIWSSETKRSSVFYWWLCVGGLVIGMTGFRIYCAFAAVFPQFFYCVFVILGMVAIGYGMMGIGNNENKQLLRGLGALSVLLIPLTLLYSRGIAFEVVTVVWGWIWLPLWVLCLVLFVKKYFQLAEWKNNRLSGDFQVTDIVR